jgi:UDP-N-acetylmuramate--alanine ligase
MSGIAEVLLDQGYTITGSDLAPNAATERLTALGARCSFGHRPEHVRGVDVVVTSSAIRPGNPEVDEARRIGTPVIPRAEMLAELMRVKYAIAVGGSHGKTTTTSLVAAVLEAGELDPTVIVGGCLRQRGSGGRSGRGEFLVAEADESDRSFLKLSPTVAVVTNVDLEHLDAYEDLEDLQGAFAGFCNRVPFYGAAVLCLDDPPTRGLLPHLERRLVSYGLSPDADFTAAEVQLGAEASRFVASARGQALGDVELPVPGRHNVLNALAAIAVGSELGVGFPRIRAGLAGFGGVERRFQRRGEAGGVLVIDDYGHHPTEIRAVLGTLSLLSEGRRRIVLFQPHRFTRTRALWSDFCRAFAEADRVLVTDIYAAGEPPIEGVDAERLAAGIEAGRGEYAGDLKTARIRLEGSVEPGDVVLTLGAGDVWKVGEELLAARGASS